MDHVVGWHGRAAATWPWRRQPSPRVGMAWCRAVSHGVRCCARRSLCVVGRAPFPHPARPCAAARCGGRQGACQAARPAHAPGVLPACGGHPRGGTRTGHVQWRVHGGTDQSRRACSAGTADVRRRGWQVSVRAARAAHGAKPRPRCGVACRACRGRLRVGGGCRGHVLVRPRPLRWVYSGLGNAAGRGCASTCWTANSLLGFLGPRR